MLRKVRYFFSDVGYWLSRSRARIALVLGIVVLVAAAAVAGYAVAPEAEVETHPAPAPQVVVPASPEPEEAEDVGFPAFATKNTTRVAGADPVASAAGVALAVYPSAGGVPGPNAVTLVDANDWHGGIAAAALVADPVGAPILITEDGEMPELTATALAALAPEGTPETDGQQAFRIGAAAEPDDLDALAVQGANPAALAAEIERLRTQLAGEPDHIVIASADEPELAMPAASWAARSGDPVLFAQRDSLPAPTRQALRRNSDASVYVLGPPSAISEDVVAEVGEINASVERVGGEDPVASAIAFARYVDGSFGWNINDPGHGLVLVNAEMPMIAAAAAPLSSAGTWGPLLVTDDASELPPPLRGYLLDLKPGFEDDPTRAVYNHVWVIGDADAIAVEVQAQIDELVELVPVGPGPGAGEAAPPGEPEAEPDLPPDEPN